MVYAHFCTLVEHICLKFHELLQGNIICYMYVSAFSALTLLPFWYRLTWVVLEKGPVKRECVCVYVSGQCSHYQCDCYFYTSLCLQCFDAVGWAAGRASGL